MRVVLLDVAHGVVDFCPDVRRLGKSEQEIEPGVGREVEDAFGVIRGGVVHAAAAARQVVVPTFGSGFLQCRALLAEPDFSEAQEDQAEDRLGVLRGAQAAIGAKLVGGGPEAFFQRVSGGVLLRWRDPDHEKL